MIESLWKVRPLAELLVALRFLTRLPLPFLRTFNLPALTISMRFFPLAGIIIGGCIGGILVITNAVGLPPLIAAAVTLACGCLITGALHEDGLADMADGFGGGKSREQRLDIMRDSRIGTYGAIALCLTFIARASVCELLVTLPPEGVILLCAAAGGFSRALVVDFLWATGPARRDGLAVYAGRPDRSTAMIALIAGGGFALFAIYYVLGWKMALLSLLGASLMLGALRALTIRMIGGQTGDVCGAAQVLTELTMLCFFVSIDY